MICPNCGTNNAEGVTFCATCGTAFQTVPVQPMNYRPAPVSEPGKGLAVASLVMGLLSLLILPLVFGILGIVFGGVAKNKGYIGGMATAGLVISIIGLASWLLMLIACGGGMFALF